MKHKITIFLLSSLFIFSSCDSFLEIKPTGSVIPETIDEYRALLTGAYADFPRDRGMACLRSDEMLVTPGSEYDQNAYGAIEKWNDRPEVGDATSFDWLKFYNVIFIANEVIDAKGSMKNGTADGINQLVGEAYLLRAYSHFVLVNLFGQPYTKPGAPSSKAVPLKLNNDLEAVLGRNTVDELYNSILSDISKAKDLVNVEAWPVEFGYRFNTKAVDAFDARARLYRADWQQAYDAAERVLAAQPALEDLNAAAPILPNLYTSVEVITALEMTPNNNVTRATFVGASLAALYTAGDLRLGLYFSAPDGNGYVKSNKSGYNKFNSTFRVGEFYLTSAEAAAQLDNLSQARTRLLQLMSKRYTASGYQAKETAVNAMNKTQLIEEILNERARELAYEGHRWYDLRRTTRPQIVKVLEGATYTLLQDDPRYAIMIPKEAIAANPGLLN